MNSTCGTIKLTLESKLTLDDKPEFKLPDRLECRNDRNDARSSAAVELPMEGGTEWLGQKLALVYTLG